MSDGREFAEMLKQMAIEADRYETSMSLYVSTEGKHVELILDTGCDRWYLDWIPGERGDAGLLREFWTNRVVGVSLPLRNDRLTVNYDGPIKINDGFLKEASGDE